MPESDVAAALSLYAKQANILDFVVAFKTADELTHNNFVLETALHALMYHTSIYHAVALKAPEFLKVSIDETLLKEYVDTLRTPVTSNGAIVAFLQRVQGDLTLRRKFLSAATSYDSLARFAAANGLTASATDLKNFLSPFELLSSLLKGLLDRGVINKKQFEERAGFSFTEYAGISGMGRDIDEQLFAAAFSASGWATKIAGFKDLKYPIGIIIFPVTAVVIGGFEGKTFSFAQIGNMLAESFTMALETLAASLEQFRESVRSIFG